MHVHQKRKRFRSWSPEYAPNYAPAYDPLAGEDAGDYPASDLYDEKRSRRRKSNLSSCQRRFIIVPLAMILLLIWIYDSAITDLAVLARFKLRDKAYERGWVKGCRLRKKPLLFIRGDAEVVVVWESNCDEVQFEFRWGEARESNLALSGLSEVFGQRGVDGIWGQVARIKTVDMKSPTSTRIVYHAILKDLKQGATYTYSISKRTHKRSELAEQILAKHEFPWLGKAVVSNPSTIHIALLADNQYNLRVFHRILRGLVRYSSMLPSSKTVPQILIHAGDQVQNPHNLPQWQTDFWDPLTSALPVPLGQTTPILLARGNHDWDSTGVNAYTGESPERQDWLREGGRSEKQSQVGTYMAYSPHERCRILVLDSNLDPQEQIKQENWLLWELSKDGWTQASLRLVVVHVPPFLEYWDRSAWTTGGESEWSVFVRKRLTPILADHKATLVMSGHQHAYSRGKLSYIDHPRYVSAENSSQIDTPAQSNTMPGIVYTIFGGAGGTLDTDKVENWPFYEKSVKKVHHFAWMKLDFGLSPGTFDEANDGAAKNQKRKTSVYTVKRDNPCSLGWNNVIDTLTWKAIDLFGEEIDSFQLQAEGCS